MDSRANMQPLLPYHRLLLRLRLFIIVVVLLLSGDRANGGFNLIQGLLRKLDDERAPNAVQEEAAMGVLRRLLPSHVSSFTFQIVPRGSCGGYSCFSIDDYNSSSKGEPEILIKGTTAVEMAFGLHWYLKYWCGAHISWDKTGGPQLTSVPWQGSLPHVGGKGVKIQRPVPWSYYQNVVTSSYSFAWWDWDRWVKEIDWMVLNGINLPLAFTGQESIWQKVFKPQLPLPLPPPLPPPPPPLPLPPLPYPIPPQLFSPPPVSPLLRRRSCAVVRVLLTGIVVLLLGEEGRYACLGADVKEERSVT